MTEEISVQPDMTDTTQSKPTTKKEKSPKKRASKSHSSKMKITKVTEPEKRPKMKQTVLGQPSQSTEEQPTQSETVSKDSGQKKRKNPEQSKPTSMPQQEVKEKVVNKVQPPLVKEATPESESADSSSTTSSVVALARILCLISFFRKVISGEPDELLLYNMLRHR